MRVVVVRLADVRIVAYSGGASRAKLLMGVKDGCEPDCCAESQS
jgi:hypothetical protein